MRDELRQSQREQSTALPLEPAEAYVQSDAGEQTTALDEELQKGQAVHDQKTAEYNKQIAYFVKRRAEAKIKPIVEPPGQEVNKSKSPEENYIDWEQRWSSTFKPYSTRFYYPGEKSRLQPFLINEQYANLWKAYKEQEAKYKEQEAKYKEQEATYNVKGGLKKTRRRKKIVRNRSSSKHKRRTLRNKKRRTLRNKTRRT